MDGTAKMSRDPSQAHQPRLRGTKRLPSTRGTLGRAGVAVHAVSRTCATVLLGEPAHACSIARALDIAGDPWSPLIIRDVWTGQERPGYGARLSPAGQHDVGSAVCVNSAAECFDRRVQRPGNSKEALGFKTLVITERRRLSHPFLGAQGAFPAVGFRLDRAERLVVGEGVDVAAVVGSRPCGRASGACSR